MRVLLGPLLMLAILPVSASRAEAGDVFGARPLSFVAVDGAGTRTEQRIALPAWPAIRRGIRPAFLQAEAARAARRCPPGIIALPW